MVRHVTGPADVLNRVRKFDSRRGASQFSSTIEGNKNPAIRCFATSVVLCASHYLARPLLRFPASSGVESHVQDRARVERIRRARVSVIADQQGDQLTRRVRPGSPTFPGTFKTTGRSPRQRVGRFAWEPRLSVIADPHAAARTGWRPRRSPCVRLAPCPENPSEALGVRVFESADGAVRKDQNDHVVAS